MLHLILWKFWFWYLFKSKRCSVNFQSFHYFTTFPSIPATICNPIYQNHPNHPNRPASQPRALKVLDITSCSIPVLIRRIGAHSAGVNLNQIHGAVRMRSQHKNPLTTWATSNKLKNIYTKSNNLTVYPWKQTTPTTQKGNHRLPTIHFLVLLLEMEMCQL